MKKLGLSIILFSLSLVSVAQTVCDSITNLTPEATYIIYRYASAWGYMVGTNENEFGEWADKYTGTGGGTVDTVQVMPARAYAATPAGYFTLKFWESTATGPGAEIYTEDIPITGLVENQWNRIPLSTPVTVPSDFFIGFKTTTTQPLDTFALLCNSTKPANTLWFHFNPGGFDMGWKENAEFTGNQMVTSMGIGMNLCVPASAEKHNPADEQITLYPNPATGQLFVECEEALSGYRIFSLQGLLIKDSRTFSRGSGIDLSDLEAGSYFIQFGLAERWITRSFVKTE